MARVIVMGQVPEGIGTGGEGPGNTVLTVGRDITGVGPGAIADPDTRDASSYRVTAGVF